MTLPKPIDRVLLLRALGQDTRMRIVTLLLQSPLTSQEIARGLRVHLPNALKHLRILANAGVLDLNRDGYRYTLRGTIRRQPKNRIVLDLGWCLFRFESSR